jgi:hypothetical protein
VALLNKLVEGVRERNAERTPTVQLIIGHFFRVQISEHVITWTGSPFNFNRRLSKMN